MAGKKIPIGVQLYSVREDCKKDLPGTIKAVAKMGYAAVEFAGYYERSAKDLRNMLDDNGLKCCGTHTQLDTIAPEKLAATIEFNQVLGNKYLIVPWLKEELRKTKAGWLALAKQFNEVSVKASAAGMWVGYHNHDFEFKPLDGELPWDIFFSNTHKDVVMQLDTGNALHGGGDPAPFLKKYPGRALTVHLKEYSATNKQALIGEGDVKWKDIFELCENHGSTEWYIVEQESYPQAPLKCIDICLQNLRKMGK